MKQTAVEWLKEIYDSCNTYEKFIANIDWEQAKAMEKEQIEDAWFDGVTNWDSEKEVEDYIKEIFKSE
jgi:hypothetical protein